ncbi:MAG: hypothetical protein ACFFB5_15170 [Promethearchaeota archaeon]
MTKTFIESNPDELHIIRRGNKLQSVFFVIMGFFFQLLFVWAYWSLLDATGPWAFFWLGLINSDYFPFISLLFLFGGGCFLIAIKEGGWIESWIIRRELPTKKPGIQKQWQLFKWSGVKTVPKDQIRSVRVHTIPLDTLKLFNRYQLEVDCQITPNSPIETHVLYSDDSELAGGTIIRLANQIQEILNLTEGVERTEAPYPTLVRSNNFKEKKDVRQD